VVDVDVLVVGAGPAGSTVAHRLATRGHRVRVVEEHPRVGLPVQCAGLVSQRVIDLAGGNAFVRTEVRGATVYGPGLGSVSFRAPETRAFVIDRAGLDIFLADRAARAGAEFRTGTRFDRIIAREPGTRSVRLVESDGTSSDVSARLVVGADGVATAVARAFRLRRPVEILPAFEAEFPASPGDPELVEVYLGRRFAPGLFGWWIPDGAGGARVGLAADADGTSARACFERMLDHLAPRFGRRLANPTAYLVSGIPIGSVPATSGDGVALVGDAAGQVKPLSGGGIYTGMRCAEILAEVADPALRSADVSARRLAEYDRRWRAELGGEFARALHLRRVFTRLSDPDLDAIVAALRGAGLTETIVAFGDIDFPTNVAGRLLRQSPSLVRLVPKALGAWWSSAALRVPELEDDSRRK
jgi:digeranylgeranylglycerophospholipid reductase